MTSARRLLTAPGGLPLREALENAVINNGGEIEKRLAFVKLATTPVNDVLYLFGQGGLVCTPFYILDTCQCWRSRLLTAGTLPVPITRAQPANTVA